MRCELRLQRPGNRYNDPVPLRGLFPKLLAARSCQRVVLRAPIILGRLPSRIELTRLFEAMQGGEQRTWLNDERAARDLFDPTRDAETVQLRSGEGLEDQQVERTMEQGCAAVCHRSSVAAIDYLYDTECAAVPIECQ
jgi:hypothetical protein